MKTKLGNFVRKQFIVAHPHEKVEALREKLARHSVAVVLDTTQKKFSGLITTADIIRNPTGRVSDCTFETRMLCTNHSVGEALEIMNNCRTSVLPVSGCKNFEGLVFKDDLFKHLALQNSRLEKQLNEIYNTYNRLEKVTNSVYDNTHSNRLLIGTDYTILFFNKKANEDTLKFCNRELEIGKNILDYPVGTCNLFENFKSDFSKALNGIPVTTEMVFNKNGIDGWFHTELFPVKKDKIVSGVSVRSKEITEKKRTEILIKEQTEFLGQIINFQSHEVRRPVASILGLINVLNNAQFSDENKEMISLLQQTARELDQVICTIVNSTHQWTNSVQQELKN